MIKKNLLVFIFIIILTPLFSLDKFGVVEILKGGISISNFSNTLICDKNYNEKIKEEDILQTKFFSEAIVHFNNIKFILQPITAIHFETIIKTDKMTYISVFLEHGELTIQVPEDENASVLVNTASNSVFTKGSIFIINCKGNIELKQGTIGKTNETLRIEKKDINKVKKIEYFIPKNIEIITRETAPISKNY